METNQDLKTYEVGGNVEWLRADSFKKGEQISVLFEAAEFAEDRKGTKFPAFLVKGSDGIRQRLSAYSVVTETGRPLPIEQFLNKLALLTCVGAKWLVKFV